MLYRETDASSVHSVMQIEEPTALLFRAGGYWWDGATWHRPSQLWDAPPRPPTSGPCPPR